MSSSPNTPEQKRAEAAHSLLRLSKSSSTSSSPTSRTQQSPTPAAAPRANVPLENAGEERDAQGALAIHQVDQHAARRLAFSQDPASDSPRYSEATGRFTTRPSHRTPPRLGMPLVDRTRPGQYTGITPQTQPAAFRTPKEMQEMARRERERRQSANESGSNRPAARSSAASEPDSAVYEERDDDDTGDYGAPGSGRKRKGKQPAVAAPQAAAGGDSDEEENTEGEHRPWRFGHPLPRPLKFNVPTGPGRWRKQLFPPEKPVDFNDRASVRRANKYTRQVTGRARVDLGLPPLRPSTQNREYDQERDELIESLYHEYAENNNNARISGTQLTAEYNEEYPGENRTSSSIASHVDRVPQLKAVRDMYRVR